LHIVALQTYNTCIKSGSNKPLL